MTKVLGWTTNLVGLALWLYGYLWGGNYTLINWDSTPARWIADFLPNIEAEIGMALMIVSMVLIYWPTRKL